MSVSDQTILTAPLIFLILNSGWRFCSTRRTRPWSRWPSLSRRCLPSATSTSASSGERWFRWWFYVVCDEGVMMAYLAVQKLLYLLTFVILCSPQVIRVMHSKHTTVQLPKDGQPDAGLTKDYGNSGLHRFKTMSVSFVFFCVCLCLFAFVFFLAVLFLSFILCLLVGHSDRMSP